MEDAAGTQILKGCVRGCQTSYNQRRMGFGLRAKRMRLRRQTVLRIRSCIPADQKVPAGTVRTIFIWKEII